MVDKRRTVFATAASAMLVVAAATPALSGFSAAEPKPLRQEPIVRLQTMATTQNLREEPVVAIGWREGRAPGSLFMTFSTDGGVTYLRDNGNLRRWAVAGYGNMGMSMDVCDDNVWVGTAANFPGDRSRDSDVLITRREIGGAAAQVFVTAPAVDRRVRDVQVACVGTNLLAVAWLERSGGKSRAKLLLRDQDSLAPAATRKVINLGGARFGAGISIAATARMVHVAWTAGAARNIRYRRVRIGPGQDPTITPRRATTLAQRDAVEPRLAAQGKKVVAAYTDRGKVRVRTSTDLGNSFSAPDTIVGTGTVRKPSRAHSVDMFGRRIVVEVSKSASGQLRPQRIESTDLGGSWKKRTFGHTGNRLGVLRKSGPGESNLAESWFNNGSPVDTLRAQYETP